jgi:hypothetical protein
MTIDTMRHDGIFDHERFLLPIHIIGVGGVGSHVAYHLAKLGCGRVNDLHVWDDDIVELHNVGNQKYDKRDVEANLTKTAALAAHASWWGCERMIEHCEYIGGAREFAGVVFICLDSMSSRWMAWETSIKRNPAVKLLIECRMEATNALIHAIDPCDEVHVRGWERYWYPDEEATNAAGCGGHLSVGPTASITADLAVWQMIRFAAVQQGLDDVLDNQIRIGMRPIKVEAFRW